MSGGMQVLLCDNIQDASSELSRNSSAAPVAGGLDMMSLRKAGIAGPQVLVPLRRFPNLSYVKLSDDRIRIGALTTLADLAENSLVRQQYPELADAAGHVGTPQVRAQATVAGNLLQRPACAYFREGVSCFKSGGSSCPAADGDSRLLSIFHGGPCHAPNVSDMAVVLTALRAVALIAGPDKKTREVLVESLYPMEKQEPAKDHTLKPGELITEISIPQLGAREVAVFMKATDRRASDHAIVSICVRFGNEFGRFSKVRIVAGGVAPHPLSLIDVSNYLMSQQNMRHRSILDAIAGRMPQAQLLAGNAYKLPLLRRLLEQALTRAYNKLSFVPEQHGNY